MGNKFKDKKGSQKYISEMFSMSKVLSTSDTIESFPSCKDDLVLGDELSINFMFLERKALLHISDTATHFSSATFLDSKGSNFWQ